MERIFRVAFLIDLQHLSPESWKSQQSTSEAELQPTSLTDSRSWSWRVSLFSTQGPSSGAVKPASFLPMGINAKKPSHQEYLPRGEDGSQGTRGWVPALPPTCSLTDRETEAQKERATSSPRPPLRALSGSERLLASDGGTREDEHTALSPPPSPTAGITNQSLHCSPLTQHGLTGSALYELLGALTQTAGT